MRTLCLLALFTPTRVFLVPASRAATPLRPVAGRTLARLPLVSMAAEMDEAEAYRTLGVTEDATYDEISVRYEELSESYAGDAARMEKVDAAKEKILDVILGIIACKAAIL